MIKCDINGDSSRNIQRITLPEIDALPTTAVTTTLIDRIPRHLHTPLASVSHNATTSVSTASTPPRNHSYQATR